MALQNYNPTSPGRRTLVSVSREGLWKGRPEKTLTEGLSSKGGRNNNGRITTRRRGGDIRSAIVRSISSVLVGTYLQLLSVWNMILTGVHLLRL